MLVMLSYDSMTADAGSLHLVKVPEMGWTCGGAGGGGKMMNLLKLPITQQMPLY